MLVSVMLEKVVISDRQPPEPQGSTQPSSAKASTQHLSFLQHPTQTSASWAATLATRCGSEQKPTAPSAKEDCWQSLVLGLFPLSPGGIVRRSPRSQPQAPWKESTGQPPLLLLHTTHWLHLPLGSSTCTRLVCPSRGSHLFPRSPTRGHSTPPHTTCVHQPSSAHAEGHKTA